MSNWYIEDSENGGFRKNRINKNKFCKKNKKGNNQYGDHIYENNQCKFCHKIDPQYKQKKYQFRIGKTDTGDENDEISRCD